LIVSGTRDFYKSGSKAQAVVSKRTVELAGLRRVEPGYPRLLISRYDAMKTEGELMPH